MNRSNFTSSTIGFYRGAVAFFDKSDVSCPSRSNEVLQKSRTSRYAVGEQIEIH